MADIIQDSDQFLVNRSDSTQTVTKANLMATIEDTDLMLVNRGGTTYTVTGEDVKDSLNPGPGPISFTPTITGDNKVGDVLTASAGAITGGVAPQEYAFLWKRNDAAMGTLDGAEYQGGTTTYDECSEGQSPDDMWEGDPNGNYNGKQWKVEFSDQGLDGTATYDLPKPLNTSKLTLNVSKGGSISTQTVSYSIGYADGTFSDIQFTSDGKIDFSPTAPVTKIKISLTGGVFGQNIAMYISQVYADDVVFTVPQVAETAKTYTLVSADVGQTISCDVTVAEPDGSGAVTETAVYGLTPIEPDRAPVIGSVNLVESNPDTAPRFTDQAFVTTVLMADQGVPQSSKQFQAKVEGRITTVTRFSEVPLSVDGQSNIYSPWVVYGQDPAGMFTAGTDTYTITQNGTFQGGPSVPSISGQCVYAENFPPVSYPPNSVLQVNGFSNDGLMFSGYEVAVLADGTRVEASGGGSNTTPGWVRVNLAGHTSPVVGFGFSNSTRTQNITSVEVGVVGEPMTVLLNDQTELNFANAINTDLLSTGEIVTQAATGTSGTVVSEPLNTSVFVSTTTGTWTTTYAVTGPEKTVVIDNATKYLDFDSSGTVTSLLDAPMDPPVVLPDESPELTLTFPSTFPSGQAPDDELGDGTTLTVDVKAVSGAFESEQSSNTVQPSVGSSLPPATLEGLVTLYDGNGSNKTVCNGQSFDLSQGGVDGMTWIKGLYSAPWHVLTDTKAPRDGIQYQIMHSNDSGVAWYPSSGLGISYYSPGCTNLGSYGTVNTDSQNYVLYSFASAPGYFDVVRYPGTGTPKSIPHTLSTKPGMIICKAVDATESWYVYHQSIGATKFLTLNTAGEELSSTSVWNDTEPTADNFTVGTNNAVNQASKEYVAYLFGNTEGLIKCGKFTGTGTPLQVDCGFEPQWLMFKMSVYGGTGGDANYSYDWLIYDSKRPDSALRANKDNAQVGLADPARFNSNGFSFPSGTGGDTNNLPGSEYVYVAIAAPVVRSLTEAEFAQQRLNFETYKNRKEVKCGEDALAARQALIDKLREQGYTDAEIDAELGI